MTLDISLLDLTGQWRPFTFAAVDSVTPSSGTGMTKWAAHWEAAARRRQAEFEDEELIALLGR